MNKFLECASNCERCNNKKSPASFDIDTNCKQCSKLTTLSDWKTGTTNCNCKF